MKKETYYNYETIAHFNKITIRDLYLSEEPFILKSLSEGFEYEVKKTSQRYKLFHKNEQVCVTCGISSSVWALQRSVSLGRYHLNLYGINKKGEYVLFTKDHIVPKSKGGKDIMENYQIMCEHCNSKKGNGEGKKTSNPKKFEKLTNNRIKKLKAKKYFVKLLKEDMLVRKTSRSKFKDSKTTARILKIGVNHPITNRISALLDNGDVVDLNGLMPWYFM